MVTVTAPAMTVPETLMVRQATAPISVILLGLGSWLVSHSFLKYRALDGRIGEVKNAHPEMRNLIT